MSRDGVNMHQFIIPPDVFGFEGTRVSFALMDLEFGLSAFTYPAFASEDGERVIVLIHFAPAPSFHATLKEIFSDYDVSVLLPGASIDVITS